MEKANVTICRFSKIRSYYIIYSYQQNFSYLTIYYSSLFAVILVQFRWHPLNIHVSQVISRYLITVVTYSKLCSYLYTHSQLIRGLSLISKFLVACSYVASYRQITAASDWSCLFCTLDVLFSISLLFLKVKHYKLLTTCSCIAISLCQLCDGSWVHGSLRQCGQQN